MLAAVAEAPVWTVSQPGAGPKYGTAPQDAAESPVGAVVVDGTVVVDGEAAVVADGAVVVDAAHGVGAVVSDGVSFGM
jgi:hypothetical protein